LPSNASEDDHLALLGLLNSSVACFWMKQVCFPKGGDSTGTRIQSEVWSRRHEFDGTKIQALPVAEGNREVLLALTRQLEAEAARYRELQPARSLDIWSEGHH